jgi:hypothetical protein
MKLGHRRSIALQLERGVHAELAMGGAAPGTPGARPPVRLWSFDFSSIRLGPINTRLAG